MSLLARQTLVATLAGCVATATAIAAPGSGQGTWETMLFARDINGHAVPLNDPSAAFFWDATMNVTGLVNMNPQSSTMDWGTAVAWADALTTGGFTDWRLPTIIDSGAPGCDQSFAGGTDCGYNVQTQVGGAYSEWAHLFYVTLGNLSFCTPGDANCFVPQPGYGLTNTAHFLDFQRDQYWSGTEFVSPGSGGAWVFYTPEGQQNGSATSVESSYAAALRSGDVLRDNGTVPEPQSLVLALAALAGLGVAQGLRRAKALMLGDGRRPLYSPRYR